MGFEALIEARRRWVSERKREGIEGVYKAQALALPLPPSFHDAVRVPRAARAVIVGYKRRLNPGGATSPFDVPSFVTRAESCGACAIAIWPDEDAHDGTYQDILAAAQASCLPVLSRDPIIDPVQIIMARAHGAAAVTLDISVLSDEEFRALFRHAIELGLDVLAEAHSALELERVASFRLGSSSASGVRLIGLAAVDAECRVDLAQIERLLPGVPEFAASIVTTGIDDASGAATLEALGIDAQVISNPLHAGEALEPAMELFAGPAL